MINQVEISVAAMHIQRLATSLSYLSGVLVASAGEGDVMRGMFGDSLIERVEMEIKSAQAAIDAVNREIKINRAEVTERLGSDLSQTNSGGLRLSRRPKKVM